MPDDNLKVDLDKIIQSAIGEKPYSVEKNFNNVMMQKAADIISGKRDDISAQYSMSQNETESDDDVDTEFTDDELEDILSDVEDEDEEYEDDEEDVDFEELEDADEAEIEPDEDEDLEDQAEPDTEEETDVEEA